MTIRDLTHRQMILGLEGTDLDRLGALKIEVRERFDVVVCIFSVDLLLFRTCCRSYKLNNVRSLASQLLEYIEASHLESSLS